VVESVVEGAVRVDGLLYWGLVSIAAEGVIMFSGRVRTSFASRPMRALAWLLCLGSAVWLLVLAGGSGWKLVLFGLFLAGVALARLVWPMVRPMRPSRFGDLSDLPAILNKALASHSNPMIEFEFYPDHMLCYVRSAAPRQTCARLDYADRCVHCEMLRLLGTVEDTGSPTAQGLVEGFQRRLSMSQDSSAAALQVRFHRRWFAHASVYPPDNTCPEHAKALIAPITRTPPDRRPS
jgi:hypothetical protein